jgi:predicted PurR-regulated permease PerM
MASTDGSASAGRRIEAAYERPSQVRQITGGRAENVLALVAALVALFVLWVAAHAFLLIFAGLLFGVLLDACVRGASYVLSVSRSWRLAFATGVLVTLIVLATWWASAVLVEEFKGLHSVINEQIAYLHGQAKILGLPWTDTPGEGNNILDVLLGHAGAVLGHATRALSIGLGAVANLAIIFIAGIFLAADPTSYRDGLTRLFPVDQRPSLRGTLDEIGEMLRWWLAGQLAAMVIIGVTVAAALFLLGVPGALLLGLQAGLLGFIPYLGPLLAAIPIALAVMPMGLFWLMTVLLVYTGIQIIEGYLLTPLIHQQAVSLLPLLTLSSMLVMGALFGIAGVILSTPFVAAGRIAVLRLYVEQRLESEQDIHPSA